MRKNAADKLYNDFDNCACFFTDAFLRVVFHDWSGKEELLGIRTL